MYELIEQLFRLFSWAWNWELPLSGFHIYPVQLGLAIFLVDVVIDTVIPALADMGNNQKGGDSD